LRSPPVIIGSLIDPGGVAARLKFQGLRPLRGRKRENIVSGGLRKAFAHRLIALIPTGSEKRLVRQNLTATRRLGAAERVFAKSLRGKRHPEGILMG